MGSHRDINFRWILQVGILVSLVLSYSLLWLRMITNPVEYTGADFITYYTVGTIGQRYGLDRVYDFDLQKAVEEDVVGFDVADENVLPHNHVPFLNPVLVLLVAVTGGNYFAGFALWDLALIGLYVAMIFTILNTMPGKIEKKPVNVVALLLFFPIFVSLLNGQDTALLALVAALLFYGVLGRRDWVAGLGLALMTVRPQMALMLALPFLFRRRAVWWWFCAGAGALVLASVLPLGPNGLRDFFHILFDTAVGSRETAMVNFVGLARRTLPFVSPEIIRGAGWLLFFAAMPALCLVWRKSRELDGRILSLAVLVTLFVSPHLVYHDLALLILPLAALLWAWIDLKAIAQKDVGLILLVISVVLLLSFVWEVTQYLFPYLLMAGLVFGLADPERSAALLLFREKTRAKAGPG